MKEKIKMEKESKRLIDIISEFSSSKFSEPISLKSSLFDMGINSISLIKIIVMIEQEFGIIFRDEDLVNENFETVNDLLDYIIRVKEIELNEKENNIR